MRWVVADGKKEISGQDITVTVTVPGEKMLLYRAVGDKEYYSIMQTAKFVCLPGGVGVKYFGKDLIDTIHFAEKTINNNAVAVVEIEVARDVVERIGDFVNVDPFLFRHGTVEIWESNLDDFNNAIINIVHKF